MTNNIFQQKTQFRNFRKLSKIKGNFVCKNLFFDEAYEIIKKILNLMTLENKTLSAKKIVNLILKSKKNKQFFFPKNNENTKFKSSKL